MDEFVPQVRYVFNLPAAGVIEHHINVLKYLNRAGIIPRILPGEKEVCRRIEAEGIDFEEIRRLPADYDVMLSPGVGFTPFERYWLQKSMAAGKINLQFIFTPAPNNSPNLFNVPRRTRFIHGVCVADTRTAGNLRQFNREVLYLLTGVPAWDRFSTEEFARKVGEIRSRFGPKLLVVGASCFLMEQEAIYYHNIIKWAQSAGFRVILQAHPARKDILPDALCPYMNPVLDRFALFAAASHLIGYIQSAMIPETLFLGTKVGCKPLAVNYHGWDVCGWIDQADQWYEWAEPLFGKDYLSILPLIHDEATLLQFLSCDKPLVDRDGVMRMFGYPQTPSFTEHALRVIETYFGKDNRENVRLILKKNELTRDMVIDYSFWDVRRDANQFRGVSDQPGFIAAGIEFLKQRRPADAYRFLERAEMYSTTDKFAFIQYLKAISCLQLNRLAEADRCIHQALFIEPGRAEYLQLQSRIASCRQMPAAAAAQVSAGGGI